MHAFMRASVVKCVRAYAFCVGRACLPVRRELLAGMMRILWDAMRASMHAAGVLRALSVSAFRGM